MTVTAGTHCAPGQTDPGIYAARASYPGGTVLENAGQYQWTLGLTLGGRCRYMLQDGEVLAAGGDVILIQANTEMSWEVLGNEAWEVVYAVFYPRPHWHELLGAGEFINGFLRFEMDDDSVLARVRRGLLGMHRIYAKSLPQRDEWTLLALERVLLTLHACSSPDKPPRDLRVNQALRYIRDNYAEPLTNRQVALAANSSVSHLASLFSREVGTSPMRYLEQLRLQRAAAMLRFTNASVKEVLTSTGFREAAYFSNRFRRYSGKSPREFRLGGKFMAH